MKRVFDSGGGSFLLARGFLFLLLLPVCLLAPRLAAQDESAAVPKISAKRCPYCKTTGKIANPYWEKHEKGPLKVIFCSHAAEEDREGHGLPFIPCRRCRNADLKAAAQSEFDALTRAQEEWIAKRREIDRKLGVSKPLLHLRTEHFAWAWNIGKFKGNDGRSRDSHAGLHLYARRMEQFYRDWQRVHGITDKDNICDLHSLYCFDDVALSKKACPLYAHAASASGKNSRQGVDSSYVNWWDRDLTPTDRDFHCEMIHNVSHLFMASYMNGWWAQECGVAYEGGAHWWEIFYCGKAGSHCHTGKRGGTGWKSERWHVIVKSAVLQGTHPRIEELFRDSGAKLRLAYHPFAWSYVDFIMQTDPAKMMQFYLWVKRKLPNDESLEKSFRMDLAAFEKAWEKFVVKSYKTRGTSPAVPGRFRAEK